MTNLAHRHPDLLLYTIRPSLRYFMRNMNSRIAANKMLQLPAHTRSTTSTSALGLRRLTLPTAVCASPTAEIAVSLSSILLVSGRSFGVLLRQHLSALSNCNSTSMLGTLGTITNCHCQRLSDQAW
jgi:hypothetical protein